MTPSERLSEILVQVGSSYITHPHWDANRNDKVIKETKAEIIELMRELVPAQADSSVPIVGLLAWDSCREKMLTSIEGLK